MKEIYFEKPNVEANNAIQDELSAFAKAIETDSTPEVTIHDGFNALDIAHRIIEKIDFAKENIS